MADNDVSKMKVADLKRELKVRGLLTTGNKNELVERLQSALLEGDVFDETGISEELLDDNDDVLNDDELDEETKSYLNSTTTHDHDEDAILKSPQGSTSSKSPDDSTPDHATLAPSQQKKVVLKRKLTASFSVNETETGTVPGNDIDTAISSTDGRKIAKISHDVNEKSDNGANGDCKTDCGADDRKVVKLSELTMKERLELRAKKFGAAAPTDALKLARAERFGISATATSIDNALSAPIVAATVSVDVLKKRAERFGGSVSQVMTKIENKEKLQKRQERFGVAAGGTDEKETVVNAQKSNDLAEKAKLRLERFKTTVK